MRLIANIAQPDHPAAPRDADVAQVTSINTGWLLSLVLHVSDKRLIGGCFLATGTTADSALGVHARLLDLASRLDAEGPGSSVIGTHLGHAALVLESQFRRRPSADQSVLSARQLRIARSLLESNLERALHDRDVAAACGISEGHLRRAFKTCTGMSPSKWRHEHRLRFCRTKLVETADPLAVVARQAGFVVQSHFSRVFTRSTGMNPSEWRRVFQSAARAGTVAFSETLQTEVAHAHNGLSP